MTYRNKTILAVVPARSESKSIPKKNIAKLNGIPLIGYVGNLLKELKFVDYSLLSTDSLDIADIGREYGIEVPFLRPKSLSGDASLSIDVWQHAWYEAEKITGKIFDISIYLEPTSPFRKVEDIYQTLDLLIDSDGCVALTVSRTPGHYTPEKTIIMGTDQSLKLYLNQSVDYSIRQTIPPRYHRNGICYAANRTTILDEKRIIGAKTYALVIDREVVNIDEPIDLNWAEFLLKISKDDDFK